MPHGPCDCTQTMTLAETKKKKKRKTKEWIKMTVLKKMKKKMTTGQPVRVQFLDVSTF